MNIKFCFSCFELKIYLFYPGPKGSKLIFNAPFRAGVNTENQYINHSKTKF